MSLALDSNDLLSQASPLYFAEPDSPVLQNQFPYPLSRATESFSRLLCVVAHYTRPAPSVCQMHGEIRCHISIFMLYFVQWKLWAQYFCSKVSQPCTSELVTVQVLALQLSF